MLGISCRFWQTKKSPVKLHKEAYLMKIFRNSWGTLKYPILMKNAFVKPICLKAAATLLEKRCTLFFQRFPRQACILQLQGRAKNKLVKFVISSLWWNATKHLALGLLCFSQNKCKWLVRWQLFDKAPLQDLHALLFSVKLRMKGRRQEEN